MPYLALPRRSGGTFQLPVPGYARVRARRRSFARCTGRVRFLAVLQGFSYGLNTEMGMILDMVVGRLREVTGHEGRRSGDYIRFPHPLSQGKDTRFSLAIKEMPDGSVSLISHKPSYTYADVLDALGLRYSDLKNRSGDMGSYRGSRIVARYTYVKPLLSPVAEVLRTDAKDFPCEWYKRGEMPLYEAHLVKECSELGREIWLVEGEKDAEALLEVGHYATTQAGGSSRRLSSSHIASLKGVSMVNIIIDCDEVGEKRARNCFTDLTAADIPCRVWAPAAGKDISDHLSAGGTVDTLVRRLDLEEVQGLPVQQALRSDADGVNFVVEPYIRVGKMTLLVSAPGVGKTSLSICIAAMVSRGEGPISDNIKRGRTLYIGTGEEDTDSLSAVYFANGGLPEGLLISNEPSSGMTPEWLRLLEATIKKYSISLVIIDALQYFVTQVCNINDARVNEVLNAYQAMLGRTGCAGLNITHARKSGRANPGEDEPANIEKAVGSIQIPASHREVLYARKIDERGSVLVTAEKGSMLVQKGKPFEFYRRTDAATGLPILVFE